MRFSLTILVVFYFVSLAFCDCDSESGEDDEDESEFMLTTVEASEVAPPDASEVAPPEASEVAQEEVSRGTDDEEPPRAKCSEPRAESQRKDDTFEIALKAAQDASEAETAQKDAGHAAAYHVQEELAERAAGAAKAARAELLGKEELVKQIQHEIKTAKAAEAEARLSLGEFQQTVLSSKTSARMANQEAQLVESAMRKAQSQVGDAQQVLENVERILRAKQKRVQGMCSSNEKSEEMAGIQDLRDTVASARKTVDDARDQAKLLESSLELARKEAVAAQEVLEGNEEQRREKERAVATARKKTKALNKKLCVAKLDLEETKLAADIAEEAASAAQSNVGRVRRRISRRAVRA